MAFGKPGVAAGAVFALLLATGCDDGGSESEPAPGPGGKADDLDDDPNGSEPDPGAEEAVCAPDDSVAERLAACAALEDSPLLQPATRPVDASDLLYYVNRWYSIDPCFPVPPSSAAVLEALRDDFVDPAGGREPELLDACGSYDEMLVGVPAVRAIGSVQLRSLAWNEGFAPMFDAAEAAGHRLVVKSGFRSAETQKATFEHWTGFEGGDADRAAVYSAQPLHSEHQLGTTADVTYLAQGGQAVDPFADPVGLHMSPAGRWIRANAHHFGIVVTYEPHKVHLHQYKPEPWHLRYVGTEAAAILHACGLSTEELLSHRYSIETPLPEFPRMELVHDAVAADGWTETACFDEDNASDPPSNGFCATHSVGGWCDGRDEVICSATGDELQRRTCMEGCCTMEPGVADACREDLDVEEIARAISCGEPS